MSASALQVEQHYTFADYCQWSEGERWELIDGVAYAMATPQRIHQKIVLELGVQVSLFLRGTPCAAYIAPFSVRLPRAHEADEQIDTTVEPDLSVICERNKLDKYGCRGAPDWIIEVLSPSTALRDLHTKRGLYERHGVKEYWIVHPTDRWLMVYYLDAHGRYGQPQIFGMQEPTPVQLFTDLHIRWDFLADEVSES